MRKKQKKILGIIIAIVLVVGLIYAFNQGIFQLPFALWGEGFTFKSMSSNVRVITEDIDLRGIWWLINAYTGGGQSIVGTLTPEDTQQLTGYETEYPLTIEASAVDQKMEYILKNTGDAINYFSYSIQTSSGGFVGGTEFCKSPGLIFAGYANAPSCPSGIQYEIKLDMASITGTKYTCLRFCISKKQAGVLSTIEPSRFKDELNITLKAKDEVLTQTVSQDNPNADFNSQKGLGLLAQVQFPASGWTGNFPPSATEYRGYYDLSENKWRITSTTRVNDYRSTFTSVDTILKNWASVNYVVKETPVSFYNTVKSEILKLSSIVSNMKTDDMSITQNAVWGNRQDINNGKIIVNLDRQIGVADLIFKVRADWLGIKIRVGKPSIVGKKCTDFKAGDNGKIDVQVKNIGSDTGTFIGSISCGTIKQSYTSSPIAIPEGQTETISIPIDAGTFAGDKYDSCQVKIQDFNKASNYVTDSVTCHILKPAICVEGDFYLENNCIKKCVDGIKKQLKCCDEGYIISWNEQNKTNEYGGYYCQSKEGDGGDGDKVLFNWLIAIPILLTIGLSALFGWKGKKGRKYNVMDFVIGGVLGGVIGMVLYFIIKHWLILTLLALLGVGGTIGAIILLGGTPLLIFLISLLARRR